MHGLDWWTKLLDSNLTTNISNELTISNDLKLRLASRGQNINCYPAISWSLMVTNLDCGMEYGMKHVKLWTVCVFVHHIIISIFCTPFSF